MFSKKTSAFTIIVFINTLFFYKYLSRVTSYALLGLPIYVFMQYALYFFSDAIFLKLKKFKKITISTITFLLIFAVAVHYKVSLDSLNVDRWSVIASFWDALFKGEYPYFAKSHMDNYPGPMPIYFLIALPFYLINFYSILSVLGYVLLVYIMRKRDAAFLLFLLLISLFMYWEIATRSTIFTFSMFVTALFYKKDVLIKKQYYITAIAVGLLLATRSVYVLPYIVFFLSSILRKEKTIKEVFTFLIISFLTFLGVFLPFIIGYGTDFFEMNPFIIQSSFLIPTSYTLLFILIAFAFSFLVKKKEDELFYAGLSLFVAIAIYALYQIYHHGLREAFFSSYIDISYFILGAPFLLVYLFVVTAKEKNNKLNHAASSF